jgi:hypothetical protein
MAAQSTNPLDCTCTYHTHRPAGENTRTDVSRNPNCPVHGTPPHLHPMACHVCGLRASAHTEAAGHVYWSNAAAAAAEARQPQGPGGAEARYISQHRPH